ncbi:MAG: cytochrome c oxidase subunit II [Pseudomonadota bacterium]|nr:cytochrome c oxidase subunit II [Pseudomonadota bacterium]
MNASPLGYLDSAGPRAHSIVTLTWFTLIISTIVCTVIAVLLWIALRRTRPGDDSTDMHSIPIARGVNGIRWITVGLLASSVPLALTMVWTMVSLAAISQPPFHPELILDVTGRQWWWEVRYDGPTPSETFVTANEIHIPVGVAVLVRLHGADVIHSFWVPKLTGKTDAIPGQTNLSWLQADHAGRYLGQCSEYCGSQHAHMQFEVVADDKADFAAWRATQLRPATAPSTAEQTRGLALVEYRCGHCHQVRGTAAGAVSAPDLTHVMSRQMLAAGAVHNDSSSLREWIQTPQTRKPNTLMPEQHLSAQQLADTLAYMESLK